MHETKDQFTGNLRIASFPGGMHRILQQEVQPAYDFTKGCQPPNIWVDVPVVDLTGGESISHLSASQPKPKNDGSAAFEPH